MRCGVTLRNWLVATGTIALLAVIVAPAIAQQTVPSLGAIRWDAWCGGGVTDIVTTTLTPPQYHSRLPWFAQVADNGRVAIHGGTQATMDREIAYAAAAGLDYWAFVMYADGDPMSQGLKLYLSSTQRQGLRFCPILHHNITGPQEQWPAERDRLVKLLQEPSAMTIGAGRPLVYMFVSEPPRQRLAELQAAAAAAGLQPYYVLMGWSPADDWREARSLGFDAISAYAAAGRGTYAQLTQRLERDLWAAAQAQSCPLVPLATTGWDRRPRIDCPPPWEANNQSTDWVETATPQEIAAHLRRALAWTMTHREVTPAQTVLIYAWNEHDEGGWLCPTWRADGTPDDRRLQALAAMLREMRGPQ